MKCVRCHQDNPPHAKFCLECGTPFPPTRETRGPAYADLQHALTEAQKQQRVTAELLKARDRELAEAHEQHTATNQILRVISRFPTDTQPVFDAIAEHGRRVCNGLFGAVFSFDGTLIHLAASDNLPAEGLAIVQRAFPRPPSDDTPVARAILHRQVIHSTDSQMDPHNAPTAAAIARNFGFRAQVVVPMLRDSLPIGAISVARREAQPFSDQEITLLQTFANQAVIAIENVRLFEELQARNAELTESLEQQTATGEILRVIASSPTDLGPVMEAVAENAARVCGAMDSEIWLLEGEHLRPVARRGTVRRPRAIGEHVRVNRR